MFDSALGSVLFEIIAILLLLSLNGLFALSEIAVVSSNKARLQQLSSTDKRANRVLALADDPTAFLSTVQIGITLISILAGALSGATVSDELGRLLSNVGWLASYADLISFTIVVVIVTFLTLLIGELIPKSIALTNPEQFAMAVAPLMQRLASVTSPIVAFLSAVTNVMLRLLRIQPNDQPPVTEEEIKTLLAEGTRAGVFEPMEQRIVSHALDLDDITLKPVLKHRTTLHWIDINDTPEAVYEKMMTHRYTAFPLCNGGVDNVLGVVRVHEVLFALENAGPQYQSFDLAATAHSPVFVPLAATPSSLLPKFLDQEVHMVFVVDEYGGTEGIVTLADILMTLIEPPE
ncbi:MAG: hemolysin family protein [Chloroflexota bacterium]